MVSIIRDISFTNNRHIYELFGTSEDTKPTGKLNGSTFYEVDTGKKYWYNEASGSWIAEATAYLEKITVNAEGATTTYTAGETFDKTGLIVTAEDTAGNSSTVSDYTFSPTGALTTTDTKVTIYYTSNGITKTDEVDITVTSVG